MNRIAWGLAAGVLAGAAGGAAADEHVLFEVQGKDTVLGTIRPADETEGILGKLAAGTTLKASVKSTQKSGPIPTLQVLLGGVPVAAAQTTTKGRATTLAPLVVAASGTYKVVVAGDGVLDGDYQLSVNWTPQKAFAGTGTSAGAATFGFSAPAGSVVSVVLAATKGSAFVPNLDDIDGPAASVVPLSGGGKASGVTLAQGGDWTLHFHSATGDGPYKVSVKVAPPKVAKHKVDIRDSTLSGAFGGSPNVVGSVVTPGDGGTVTVDDATSPIDGSSVTIPPDSLGKTTTVFVASAAPYTPPGGDHPAGPAVEFGPSGTTFDTSKPATVTIPFDPNAFPGGTSALVVYVKDSKGEIQPVLPTSSYVFGANTVTFTTSHFSTFQPATNAARGAPFGTYTIAEVTGVPAMTFSGSTGVGMGIAFLNTNGFSSIEDLQLVTLHAAGVAAPGPSAQLDAQTADVNGGLISQVDDTTIDVTTSFGTAVGRLRRGLDDQVLTFQHTPGDLRIGGRVLLRRIDGRPTLNSLAGKWNVLVWEMGSAAKPASGAATIPVSVVCDAGDAVIGTDGKVAFHLASRVKRSTDLPSGDWKRETSVPGTTNASIFIDPDFIVNLQFTAGTTSALDVCVNGDVLAGRLVDIDRGFGVADAQVALMLLVRQSSAASAALVAADYADDSGGVDLHAPDGSPPPDTFGAQWHAEWATTTISAKAQLTTFGTRCLSITGAIDPTTSFTEFPVTSPARVTIAPDGTFAVPSLSYAGAAGRSGGYVLYLRRDATMQGFGIEVRLP
jgi:hypothetical protein